MLAMWPHFVNLLVRSWNSFREALGTTTLGFVAPLVVSVFSIVATLYYVLRQRGREAMLKHWKEDAVMALRVTAIVTVLVYGPILFYAGLVKTVYSDHQNQTTRIAQLQHDNPAKDNEIAGLKARLADTCYMPDRRLTREQRDLLYTALKATAEKYNHPRIVTGYFTGDMESLRYWYSIHQLLKDTGFDVEKEPITKPQRKKADDPPDFGFAEGLSIQTQVLPVIRTDNVRLQIALAISQNFNDSGVEMKQYPVGPGNVLKESSRTVIWIGIKNPDWLNALKRP
jgi:hypothetical protein